MLYRYHKKTILQCSFENFPLYEGLVGWVFTFNIVKYFFSRDFLIKTNRGLDPLFYGVKIEKDFDFAITYGFGKYTTKVFDLRTNKFLKLYTWKNIIKSRWIYYQNRNKDWYKKRKAICDVCPHNSKYHKKTIYERLLGRYCKICKCPLKYKMSLDFVNCGLEEIGEEPKWKSVWK